MSEPPLQDSRSAVLPAGPAHPQLPVPSIAMLPLNFAFTPLGIPPNSPGIASPWTQAMVNGLNPVSQKLTSFEAQFAGPSPHSLLMQSVDELSQKSPPVPVAPPEVWSPVNGKFPWVVPIGSPMHPPWALVVSNQPPLSHAQHVSSSAPPSATAAAAPPPPPSALNGYLHTVPSCSFAAAQQPCTPLSAKSDFSVFLNSPTSATSAGGFSMDNPLPSPRSTGKGSKPSSIRSAASMSPPLHAPPSVPPISPAVNAASTPGSTETGSDASSANARSPAMSTAIPVSQAGPGLGSHKPIVLEPPPKVIPRRGRPRRRSPKAEDASESVFHSDPDAVMTIPVSKRRVAKQHKTERPPRRPRAERYWLDQQADLVNDLQRRGFTAVMGQRGVYVCSLCGKDFETKLLCVRHAVEHLDYKPFKCTDCYMEFTRCDTLQRHLKGRCLGVVARPRNTSPDDGQAEEPAKDASQSPQNSDSSVSPDVAEKWIPPVVQPSGQETPCSV